MESTAVIRRGCRRISPLDLEQQRHLFINVDTCGVVEVFRCPPDNDGLDFNIAGHGLAATLQPTH